MGGSRLAWTTRSSDAAESAYCRSYRRQQA